MKPPRPRSACRRMRSRAEPATAAGWQQTSATATLLSSFLSAWGRKVSQQEVIEDMPPTPCFSLNTSLSLEFKLCLNTFWCLLWKCALNQLMMDADVQPSFVTLPPRLWSPSSWRQVEALTNWGQVISDLKGGGNRFYSSHHPAIHPAAIQLIQIKPIHQIEPLSNHRMASYPLPCDFKWTNFPWGKFLICGSSTNKKTNVCNSRPQPAPAFLSINTCYFYTPPSGCLSGFSCVDDERVLIARRRESRNKSGFIVLLSVAPKHP